jgi:IS1 transposase
MLVKLYGQQDVEGNRRYSPAECLGCERHIMVGDPDPAHISTSIIERQNLTMRMSIRRFTRLTNGFSKKVENHAHAVALHFMFYNFARVHSTLRCTPAMRAGVTDHKWSIEEIVGLLPELKYNTRPKKAG